jgi:hypothetical protein
MRAEKALSPTVGRIDLDRVGFVDTPSMLVVYLQGPRGTEGSTLNSNASGDLTPLTRLGLWLVIVVLWRLIEIMTLYLCINELV